MIEGILATPITAINVKTIAEEDELNVRGLLQFIDELKPALINYNTTAQLPKVKKTVQ